MIKFARLPSMIEIVFKREVYRIRVSRALELIQRLPLLPLSEEGNKRMDNHRLLSLPLAPTKDDKYPLYKMAMV